MIQERTYSNQKSINTYKFRFKSERQQHLPICVAYIIIAVLSIALVFTVYTTIMNTEIDNDGENTTLANNTTLTDSSVT